MTHLSYRHKRRYSELYRSPISFKAPKHQDDIENNAKWIICWYFVYGAESPIMRILKSREDCGKTQAKTCTFSYINLAIVMLIHYYLCEFNVNPSHLARSSYRQNRYHPIDWIQFIIFLIYRGRSRVIDWVRIFLVLLATRQFCRYRLI